MLQAQRQALEAPQYAQVPPEYAALAAPAQQPGYGSPGYDYPAQQPGYSYNISPGYSYPAPPQPGYGYPAPTSQYYPQGYSAPGGEDSFSALQEAAADGGFAAEWSWPEEGGGGEEEYAEEEYGDEFLGKPPTGGGPRRGGDADPHSPGQQYEEWQRGAEAGGGGSGHRERPSTWLDRAAAWSQGYGSVRDWREGRGK